MVFNSKDANNYTCCQVDRQCVGDKCAAWKEHFIEVQREKSTRLPFPPLYERDGNGYCGLIK